MSDGTYTINLKGCSPTPLAHYLKALGIFRIIAEQADANALGWWKNDSFWLQSNLDEEALRIFFIEEYAPTPIVVPWSGSDFFATLRMPNQVDFNKKWPITSAKDRPKGETVIDAVNATQSVRLRNYREMIQLTFRAMSVALVETKDDLDSKKGKRKPYLLTVLRNLCPDEFVRWLDVTSVVSDLASHDMTLNCLLGGGGGSDGNAHFSDNFMQCLWLCLPDFDEQKRGPTIAIGDSAFSSLNAIGQSLFGIDVPGTLIKDLSPALFNSQSVGGANSSAGFSADAASNPWDYVLMLEGSLILAGAASRRYASSSNKETAFPFSVNVTPIGNSAFTHSESNAMAREVWLPLWEQAMSVAEIGYLFSEARISVGKRHAKNGIDVARAIAGLGVDRGITEFQRIALLRGRIGGDNYFTACNAGRFRVKSQPGAEELLAPLDNWLDRFRRAATGKNAPARAGRALRQLESSILNLCQRGNAADIQATLIALGEAEASVAISKDLREGSKGSGINPLPLLHSDWLLKGHDGSCEFRVAAAIASIMHDSVGPFRRHLEPVDRKSWKSKYTKWAKDASDPAIVWGSSSLTSNLCAVLNRRLIDVMTSCSDQNSSELLAPLRGRLVASLADVVRFISGEVDDALIEALLKALCLVDFPQSKEGFAKVMKHLRVPRKQEPLPTGGYGLLKLCFLPHLLNEKGIVMNPQIARRAILGDGAEATRLAARRLTASGFVPAVEATPMNLERTRRIAAALLIPISTSDAEKLAKRVLRMSDSVTEKEPNDIVANL